MNARTKMSDDTQHERLQAGPQSGNWTFFRQWLKSPLSTAALAPSGRQLAQRMIAELPGDARRIIELGAGTGVFTRELLRHGIAERDLLILELNEKLFEHLHEQLPTAQIYRGDARNVGVIAKEGGFLKHGPADAVISGLGLLAMSRRMQTDILRAALTVLKPEGRFIQFTYWPKPPISHKVLTSLGLRLRRAGFALLNLPPATVYVLTRSAETQ